MTTEVTTMKVVTVRDFRDRATEMFRSDDVILVTRDGYLPGFSFHGVAQTSRLICVESYLAS
jgi:hypothetical protein